MSEKGIVDYLVQLSSNFLHAYEIIHDLQYDIKVKRDDFLSEVLQAYRKNRFRRYMRTTLQTVSTRKGTKPEAPSLAP